MKEQCLNEGAPIPPNSAGVAADFSPSSSGPIGWFYAGPLKNEAIGVRAYLLMASILPQFILSYIVGIVAPISAITGAP